MILPSLLTLDAESFGDALFGAFTLVAAVNDVADGGVGDAEAFRQLLLGDVLFYHCDFHFLAEWGAWDSGCHIGASFFFVLFFIG